MTADQFAYWLQGFAELNAAPPTEDQWCMIRDHLGLVPNRAGPDCVRRYKDNPHIIRTAPVGRVAVHV